MLFSFEGRKQREVKPVRKIKGKAISVTGRGGP
jgi:hypothetical protein